MAIDREVTLHCTCALCLKKEDIVVKEDDYLRYRIERLLIQDAFPYLSKSQREIIQSGACGTCFDKMWPEE